MNSRLKSVRMRRRLRFTIDVPTAEPFNDMDYSLRPATDADFDFAYEVKQLALGPHVSHRWGWNDDLQRRFHTQRWGDRPWFVIEVDGVAAGTVSVEEASSHIQFGELYLKPQYQRQGIGSAVLAQVLARADAAGKPVRLEHLKWNPAASLYRRHGFSQMNENDSHCFLVRLPAKG